MGNGNYEAWQKMLLTNDFFITDGKFNSRKMFWTYSSFDYKCTSKYGIQTTGQKPMYSYVDDKEIINLYFT